MLGAHIVVGVGGRSAVSGAHGGTLASGLWVTGTGSAASAGALGETDPCAAGLGGEEHSMAECVGGSWSVLQELAGRGPACVHCLEYFEGHRARCGGS